MVSWNSMLEASPKKDWLGVGFELLKANGENVDMVVGIRRRQDPRVEWTFVPHFESDGLSALKRVLTDQGYEIGELPRTRAKRPGISGLLRAIWEYARHQGEYEFPWKQFDPNRTGRSPGIASIVLTAEQTKAVQAHAREARATINTTLLLALQQSVVTELAGPFETGRWLVPFNLRGALPGHAEHSNQASYLTVDIKPGAKPRAIEDQMLGLIARHYPWGSWFWLRLVRWLGRERIQKLQAKSLSSGKTWVGAFSNLGIWQPPARAGAADTIDSLVVCPPVFRVLPIGAASINWRGRLGLALQLHPGLGKTLGETEALLGRWVEEVLRATTG